MRGRRLIFSGEALVQWRPFFGATMGGEHCHVRYSSRGGGLGEFGGGSDDPTSGPGECCGCVHVNGLRKSTLLKGQGPGLELLLAAATAATVVVPRTVPAAATLTPTLDTVVCCRCDTCDRGITLGRFEAVVLGADPMAGMTHRPRCPLNRG